VGGFGDWLIARSVLSRSNEDFSEMQLGRTGTTAMLRTCRTINHEASAVLYGFSTFVFRMEPPRHYDTKQCAVENFAAARYLENVTREIACIGAGVAWDWTRLATTFDAVLLAFRGFRKVESLRFMLYLYADSSNRKQWSVRDLFEAMKKVECSGSVTGKLLARELNEQSFHSRYWRELVTSMG
jgi:hypothetical protein